MLEYDDMFEPLRMPLEAVFIAQKQELFTRMVAKHGPTLEGLHKGDLQERYALNKLIAVERHGGIASPDGGRILSPKRVRAAARLFAERMLAKWMAELVAEMGIAGAVTETDLANLLRAVQTLHKSGEPVSQYTTATRWIGHLIQAITPANERQTRSLVNALIESKQLIPGEYINAKGQHRTCLTAATGTPESTP